MALADLINSFFGPPQSSDQSATPVSAVTVNPPTASPASVLPVQPMSASRPFVNGVNQNPNLSGPISFYPDDPGASQNPQPVPMNYNNSQASDAVQAADAQDAPRGGSANPGLYGLLPQNLQHGTLRNVLGALGDAFLVAGHQSPGYANNMARQAEGNAMAGMDVNDPNSVAAAAQRIAATGSPGAADLADKVTQQGEQAALRREYMQYNQDYREQVIGARNQNMVRQAAPQMQYYLSQATDAADYKTRLDYIQHRVQAIDPSLDAAAELGVPSADDWKPGSIGNLGMTSQQATVSSDKGKARENAVTVAQIGAGGHYAASTGAASISANKPTEGTIMSGLIQKQNGGQTLSDAEQRYFDAHTQVRAHSRGLAPNLTPGGGGTTAATPAFQNNHVYTDAKGRQATYLNGKWIPK